MQVTLATIGTYVQVHKNDPNNRLTAERAFVTLSLFNILRFPVYMLPQIISSLVEVRSICRVEMAIVVIQEPWIKEDSTIEYYVQCNHWNKNTLPFLGHSNRSQIDRNAPYFFWNNNTLLIRTYFSIPRVSTYKGFIIR